MLDPASCHLILVEKWYIQNKQHYNEQAPGIACVSIQTNIYWKLNK